MTASIDPSPSPLISIIIPAYNQSVYLRSCIDSALAQTYPRIEVIVVNDGSTDNTAAIADSYGSQIRTIHQANMGLGGARNRGIRAAQGEYVGLLDADDLWEPNYLEVIVSLMAINPGAGVFFSQAQCIDEKGTRLPQLIGYPAEMPQTPTDMYRAILKANFLLPSTVTIRRTIFDRYGYFDPTLRSCQDWDLWMRIAPENLFIGTDEALVQYRVHGQSLSANILAQQASAKKVFENHFGPDDGQPAHWSATKKLAYSGLYRYILTTSILRRDDWEYGREYLRKTLLIDSANAVDIDLFYELALGSQPLGHRGTVNHLEIEKNATHIEQLLSDVFQTADHNPLKPLKQKTYGTANYALGLLAYNTNHRSLCRRYLRKAMSQRQELCSNRRALSIYSKSFLGSKHFTGLRALRDSLQDLFRSNPTKKDR